LTVDIQHYPPESHSGTELMSAPSGIRELHSALVIWLVGADLFLQKQNFHHTLLSFTSGMRERHSAHVIWLVGVDSFALE